MPSEIFILSREIPRAGGGSIGTNCLQRYVLLSRTQLLKVKRVKSDRHNPVNVIDIAISITDRPADPYRALHLAGVTGRLRINLVTKSVLDGIRLVESNSSISK